MERSSATQMDPTLSLAFAMHSNRGVYALLLGSGVSRSAAIPTGWEVVIDLIRKLAAMQEATCEPSPEAWFEDTHGEEPTYSGLLKKLCRTPAERQQILRSYFEPSAEEAASGQKEPTKAHQAVAALAKSGHVRLVLTTNFDRLMERSLEAAGVSPVVISTANAVDGATPLTHAPCTLVKLHGDYLDARIKNTPEELAKYDRRFDRLLDRVFDEFGLVVVGWSADWDEALVKALSRCKSRRFTTYWALRGKPSDAAQRLITLRGAETVAISGADEFFQGLHEKILSLASFDAPHPLSMKAAVATMKRYLADDRHRIELHDLVMDELERVMAATTDEKMPVSGSVPPTVPNVRERLARYESVCSVLLGLVATGCFWGGSQHAHLWKAVLERLARRPSSGGVGFLIELCRYPAALAMYAGGIAATASMNMTALKAVLLMPRLRLRGDDLPEHAPLDRLHAQAVMDTDEGRRFLPNADRRYTPTSEYLLTVLREPLRAIVPSDEAYEAAFDRFEYFLALLYVDRRLKGDTEDAWAPIGRFGWKGAWGGRPPLIEQVEREAIAADIEWPPIKSGLLTSLERFKTTASVVEKSIARRGWH